MSAPSSAPPLPSVRGTWILPDDPAFPEAVFGRVFNARRPNRRPAAVMRAAVAVPIKPPRKTEPADDECGGVPPDARATGHHRFVGAGLRLGVLQLSEVLAS